VSRRDERDSRRTLEHYKRLILLGKISLPLDEARRIVGPDCAYHLYFRHADEGWSAGGDEGKRKPKPRGRRHK
jgi:hypothetical protein